MISTKKSIFETRTTQIEYTEGQKKALTKVDAFLSSGDNFFLLAGYSGCGKTTIAENIANYKTATLLAPTNAAVNRLREKIANKRLLFKTIHKQLFSKKDEFGKFIQDRGLLARETYIVDECSMIDKYILEILIKEATTKKCKLIFMGDSFQLEPVGENPKIFLWEKSYPEHFKIENKYELTEVKRYDGSLLKIATEIRINKKPVFTNPENSDLIQIDKFNNQLAIDIKNNNNYVVLTSTNSRRVLYNEKIRNYKYKLQEYNKYILQDDLLVSVSNNNMYSNGELFINENAVLMYETKITLTEDKNFKEYDILIYTINSELVFFIPDLVEASFHGQEIVEAVEEGRLILPYAIQSKVILKNKQDDSNYLNRDVVIATYGYAISCHKAQGQEWDNVYIDAEWMMPVWDKAKWFYTAITRAKCKVQLVKNRYILIK